MIIFELIKPGVSPTGNDPETEARLFQTLNAIIECFYKVNTALNLFEEEKVNTPKYFSQQFDNNEKWLVRRAFHEKKYRNENSIQPFEYPDDMSFKLDVAVKRERWAEGFLPFQMNICIADIYAQAFLNSIDLIRKYIKSLSHDNLLPHKIKNIYTEFKDAFSDLDGVRNSLQHQEQRLKGEFIKKGRPEKIDLKPFDIGIVQSNGEALIGEGLLGNVIISTMEDGHLGGFEVSIDTLNTLGCLVQKLLDGFEWVGFPVHFPR